MRLPPQGNGSGKFDIGAHDMGGWVRVMASETGQHVKELPAYLSLHLTNWFRSHPNLRMRCVVPVCRDGNTVELHAWYDAHLFPDLSNQGQGE